MSNRITTAARRAYQLSLDATGDRGCANDAACEAIRFLTADVEPGTWDEESLTWTRDESAEVPS